VENIGDRNTRDADVSRVYNQTDTDKIQLINL